MARLAAQVRVRHERDPNPSMVMIDAQTVKGGRYGPTFHNAGGRGGRTIGTKRTILVEILGLPVSARADPARPHDVRVGRDLLRDSLAGLPRVGAIVAYRGYRGLCALADRRNLRLDIKAPPKGQTGFRPIAPLYKVEHAFAQLGRWRRLSRCYEGSEASATTWLKVASVGYLLGRAWLLQPSDVDGSIIRAARREARATGEPRITPAPLGRQAPVRIDPTDRSARPQVICRPDRHRDRRR
jgi:putative transposase